MESTRLNSCLMFGLLASLVHVQYVRADYQVKVQLFTFENPTHQFPRSPGADPPVFCCDGGTRDPCTGDICDISIVLCLNPFGLPVASRADTNCDNDTMRVSEVFTTPNPTMDVDDITFDVGETALLGLPNPFIINQTGEWPGGIQLVVQVLDDDSSSSVNSDVDDTVQSVIINIDQLGASPPVLIVGAQDVGMINVSYEVACTENYYGPNCTTFCEERDDEQGHYTCDSEGNIVCRDGYNDTSTNCTECIPADGCSPVGGYCTEGNECVCYPEYTGDLCESDLNICRQITCQNGGTCMNTGPDMYECMCPEEFEGVNCEFDRTDECDPDPCENGATCVDLVADYSCNCPPGFIGKNCDREESSSSEGVDAATIAGGAVGIVLLILFILILVVVLVLLLRNRRHRKVQIITDVQQELEPAEYETSDHEKKGVQHTGSPVPRDFDNPLYDEKVVQHTGSSVPRDFDNPLYDEKGVQNTGSSVQHKFDNPLYDEKGVQNTGSSVQHKFDNPLYDEKGVQNTVSSIQQNTGSSVQHDFDNPLYDESLPKNNHAAPTTVTQPEVYYSSVTNPSSSLQAPGPTLEYDYAENPSGKGGSLSVYDSADDPTTSQAVYARPEAPPMGTTNGAPPIHEYDYAFTDKPVYADPDSRVPPPAAEMVPTIAADHYEFGPDFDS